MKNKFKTILLLIAFIFSFWNIQYTFASDEIKINTTTKIPWAKCSISTDKKWYTCSIKPWFKSVLETIQWIIKWFTAIALLARVLFIVVNGILLSMWWLDSGAKEQVKKRISKSIIWLILLLMSWYILNIIAPWVYTI